MLLPREFFDPRGTGQLVQVVSLNKVWAVLRHISVTIVLQVLINIHPLSHLHVLVVCIA